MRESPTNYVLLALFTLAAAWPGMLACCCAGERGDMGVYASKWFEVQNKKLQNPGRGSDHGWLRLRQLHCTGPSIPLVLGPARATLQPALVLHQASYLSDCLSLRIRTGF